MSASRAVPPQPDDDLVVGGDWGQIRHAKRTNGRMEAKEWLVSATESQRSKFDHLFRKMAATGRISNDEHFKKLDGEIWEFKRDGDRILCFQQGRCWRLTHHYPKGGRKCPRSQIEYADNIR